MHMRQIFLFTTDIALSAIPESVKIGLHIVVQNLLI
jgi:hypothetical protein